MSLTPQAVVYREFGPAEQVLQLVDAPAAEPEPHQVTLALRAASLNPSDFGMIAGSYGKRPQLPAVAGREGWGEVVRMGSQVRDWQIGDRARMPESAGVLRQAVTVDCAGLLRLPASLSTEQAAMAFINPPTAYRLLHDFITLQAGDWIVQNAANSAVGLCICGFARKLGINVLALCRNSAERKAMLLDAGATAVAGDDDNWVSQLDSLTSGKRPRLGLNSIGGASVQRIIKMLADGGVCVTYGGMTGEAIRFPTRYLIFNNVQLRGFWMDRWLREHSAEHVSELMNSVFDAFTSGELVIPVEAEYPFAKYNEAFAHASRGGRGGKIIIHSAWHP